MWIICKNGNAINTDRVMCFDIESDGQVNACEDSKQDSGWVVAQMGNRDRAQKFVAELVKKLNAEKTA